MTGTALRFPTPFEPFPTTWPRWILRGMPSCLGTGTTGLNSLVWSLTSTQEHLPIDDAKTLLQCMLDEQNACSFYYEFHVAIILRSKANPDDAAEKERVRSLMDLLVPYI